MASETANRLSAPSVLRSSASLGCVLLLMVVLFGVTQDRFFTLATLQSLLNQIPAMMFVSAGMTLVLITGGIDLSVGAVIALTSAILGVLMSQWHWSLAPAVTCALTAAAIAGTVNGLITITARVPSFIVTLGTLQVCRGIAIQLTQSRSQYIGSAIGGFTNHIPGLGLSSAFVVAIAFVAACHFLLTRTVFGRHCVAIGANEPAAKLSGIRIQHPRLAVFVLSAFCAGVAGVIETSRLQTGDPGGAKGFELLAIASAVIGGTSLSGGRGSMISTFLGVLIIAVLQTGLIHAGAGEGTKYIITGTVTILAVAADMFRR